jgi:uncharacterized protein
VSEENIDLVRQLYERWATGDFMTPEFFDQNAEMVRVGGDATGLPGTWRGLENIWKASTEWMQAWENLRLKPIQWFDLGDRVLVVARSTGRGRSSGLPLDQENAQLFTLRDGKIVRWELYHEVGDALRAAGLDD